MTMLLRSLLFVPAVRERFIEKAPQAGADLICLDMEDSVPPGEKDRGREMAREAVSNMPRTGYLMCVRVNSLQSGLVEEDLAAVVSSGLDAISLPKAEGPQIIDTVDRYLTLLERSRGLSEGQVKIIPWIETALGLVNAYQICAASPRLIGAAVGGEDLTADMGIQRTKGGKEIEHARYVVATAASAAGILPLDTPFTDFRDPDGLKEDSLLAKSLGYKGKFCIHPSQVEIVNQVYQPSEEEVEYARKVVAAYKEGAEKGLGAVSLDGVMVDKPVYDRAITLLERVEAIKCKAG
ncbi:MAG: HpcH/HpaI aldolase/citrate lyase family protein [Dehalococcoidia bacterium]